jgi:hypothetical protein
MVKNIAVVRTNRQAPDYSCAMAPAGQMPARARLAGL